MVFPDQRNGGLLEVYQRGECEQAPTWGGEVIKNNSMKIRKQVKKTLDREGSALILVLWSLVLIGFLAGEYLDHNRGRAALAVNAWDSLKQREAIDSVLHLFATDSWPLPGQADTQEGWIKLSPGGVDLWVKVEDESNRVNINTAADTEIKAKILELLGEECLAEAALLSDAILDWRDADPLVRINGAEAEFYNSRALSYGLADGPFKVLTELLLVRGMNYDLFWGKPLTGFIAKEENETKSKQISILDTFTIYSENVKRISIMAPGRQEGYSFVVGFLEKKNGRWELLQLYQTMLTKSSGETELGKQQEAFIGLS